MCYKNMKKLISLLLVLSLFVPTSFVGAFTNDDLVPSDDFSQEQTIRLDDDLVEEDQDKDFEADPNEEDTAVSNLEDDAKDLLHPDAEPSAASALEPGVRIKRARIIAGATATGQVVWRNAEERDISLFTVYKGDHPTLAVNGEDPNLYYTTARQLNRQDPRVFTVEVVIPKDTYTGIGTAEGQFNPANVRLDLQLNGTNAFSSSLTTNTTATRPAPANVSARFDESGGFIIWEGDVRTVALGGSESAGNNVPYANWYRSTRLPGAAEVNRTGDWPLIARYGTDVNSPWLGYVPVRAGLNDSFRTWDEMDEWANRYIAANPEGNGIGGGTAYGVNGRYMRVQSFGKSHGGRDLWGVVISDSRQSVEDYLNITVPLMNSNPTLMRQQIKDGTFHHKGVVMHGAIHGNEVMANGLLPDLRDRLMKKETIRMSTRTAEGSRWVAPTSNSNVGRTAFSTGSTHGTAGANRMIEMDVDELLDKYIIVLNLWTNPDGNVLQNRGNIYGDDANRDGGIFTYLETRATMKWMNQWDPIYYIEHHDQVNPFQIDGCTPPTEASLEADLIDRYMIPFLEALGQGYISNTGQDTYTIPMRDRVSGWDAATNVYAASMAMMNGSLGSTLEFPNHHQDGNDAGLQAMLTTKQFMLEEYLPVMDNKLEYKERGVLNIDAKDKVDPLLRSVHPRFAQYRADGLITFTPTAAVDMPRPRERDAEGNELSFFPEYWVIPVDKMIQAHPVSAVEFLAMLQDMSGIEVGRTTEMVTTNGITYPPGTYVVSMHQGRRSFANSVLYGGYDTSNFSGLYDSQTLTNWNSQYGFNAYKTWETGVFEGKTEPLTVVKDADLPGDGEWVAYINGGHDAIRLTNRLLKDGKPVYMVTGYVPGAALGDFVARRMDILANLDIRDNASLGPIGLGVIGVDVGNTVPVNTKQLVRPRIAISRPGMNNARFMYDALGFDADADFNTTLGAGSVFVGTAAPTAAQAAYGAVLYNVAASVVNNANVLGTGAVTAATSAGNAEMIGRANWHATSLVAANHGPFDRFATFSNNRYGTVANARSDIKVLGSFVHSNDIYMGGRKGATNANAASNRGTIFAVSGVRANGSGVTSIIANVTRNREQQWWNLLGTSIFAYAAGIADVPRPVVTADVLNNFVDVQLNILAEDTVGVNATVAVKKVKLSDSPVEPAYNAADLAWKTIPAGDQVTAGATGAQYIHWYVENSKGVNNQGTFGPYEATNFNGEIGVSSVQVHTGGATQILYRDSVYRGVAENGENPANYYTTDREFDLSDPRTFHVEFYVTEEDLGGATPAAFLNTVNFTYGGHALSAWGNSNTLRGSTAIMILSNRQIVAVDGGYKVSADIRVNTPFATANAGTNVPYNSYVAGGGGAKFGTGQFNDNRSWWQAGPTRQGIGREYALEAVAGDTALASTDIRIGSYRGMHSWIEINEFSQSLIEALTGSKLSIAELDERPIGMMASGYVTNDANGKFVKGNEETDVYVEVHILGYGHTDNYAPGNTSYNNYSRFNAQWNIVVAKDFKTVDDYLKPGGTLDTLNHDPKALYDRYKNAEPEEIDMVTVYYQNNTHADEVTGTENMIHLIKYLIEGGKAGQVIPYRTVEDSDVNWRYRFNAPGYPNNTSTHTLRNGLTGTSRTPMTFDTGEMLDHFIFASTLCSNPDGKAGMKRTNRYNLDMNRDVIFSTQPETISLTNDIAKWNPILFNEWHGYVTQMLIEPCTAPHAPTYEYDLLQNNMLALAYAGGKAIQGSTGYADFRVPWDHLNFGDWDDGGNIYAPMFSMLYGTMGYTIELPHSNLDSLEAGEVLHFAMLNEMLRGKTTFFEGNLLNGQLMDLDGNLRDSHAVDNQYTSMRKSTIMNLIEYKIRGMDNIDSMAADKYFIDRRNNQNVVVGRPRVDDGVGGKLSFFPDYVMIPTTVDQQYNVAEAVRTLNHIIERGAKVSVSTAAVSYEGVTYPAGAYVVDMRQANRNYVFEVMGKGYDATYFGSMYADIYANFPDVRGFDSVQIWNKLSGGDLFAGKLTNVGAINKFADIKGSPTDYIAFKSQSVDAVRFVNLLLSGRSSGPSFAEKSDVWMLRNNLPGVLNGEVGTKSDYVIKASDLNKIHNLIDNPDLGLLGCHIVGEYIADLPEEAVLLVEPIITTNRTRTAGHMGDSNNRDNYIYWALDDYLGFTMEGYNGDSASTVRPGANVALMHNAAPSGNLLNAIRNDKLGLVLIQNASVLTNANFGTGNASAPSTGTAFQDVAINGTYNVNDSLFSANYAITSTYYARGTNYSGANLPTNAKVLFRSLPNGADAFIGGFQPTSGSKGMFGDRVTMFSSILKGGGITGKPVQSLVIGQNVFNRGHYQKLYPMLATAIFAGAAGILDDQVAPEIQSLAGNLAGTTYKLAVDATDDDSGVACYEFYRWNNVVGEYVLMSAQTGNTFDFTGLNTAEQNKFKVVIKDWADNETIREVVPTHSVKIDALSIFTVARYQTYHLNTIVDVGASKDIVWAIADPSLGYVDHNGTVTIFDKTGNVRLTATDLLSGATHSITLRIAS